jgi:hypothetical protein
MRGERSGGGGGPACVFFKFLNFFLNLNLVASFRQMENSFFNRAKILWFFGGVF